MFGGFVFAFTYWRFARDSAKVIGDLVLHDADEPGAFRAAALKVFISLDGGEEGFLNYVFGGSLIAQSKHSVLEEIIAVLIQPCSAIGFFFSYNLRDLWIV